MPLYAEPVTAAPPYLRSVSEREVRELPLKRRSSNDRKVELLSKVSLFGECNARELSRIAALADEIEVEKGAVLTKEGMPGRECFVVSEGKATARLRAKKLASYGPGDVLGEMAPPDN